jgi:hypothetical protein
VTDEPRPPDGDGPAAARAGAVADPTSEAQAIDPAAPIEADAEPAPPAPTPFAALPTGAGRVVARAFDVLTHASGDLRRASFYIGLLVLLLATPFAIVLWRISLEPLLVLSPEAEAANAIVAIIALGGIVVATIEGRAVAVVLLGSKLAGRPLDLRAAVQRSRTVFWRLLAALALTNVPLFLVQSFLDDRAADLFGGVSEPSVLSAAIVSALLFSPLTYVVTGVVLGDVGPWTAVRRSFRLFGARKLTAVVVALFDFGAQLLTAFGLLAGLDLVIRGVEAAGLSGGDELGAAVTVGLIVILLFALGSLLFTVAALATAPQVVAFLGLTHTAPGLERIGGERSTFRWLTRLALAAMVVAAVAMFSALSSVA